jgi:hypothetical protein
MPVELDFFFVVGSACSPSVGRPGPRQPDHLYPTLAALGRIAARRFAAAARAREPGSFGSPTLVRGAKLFRGDNGLDDVLAWVQARGRVRNS